MKNFFSRLTLVLAVVALALSPVGKAQAQGDIKPAVVVLLAPADEQFSDATFFLKAAGMGFFSRALDPVQQEGATFVDSKRPIGGFLTVDAQGDTKFCAFLPITDFDRFLEKLEDFVVEQTAGDDGVTQLSMVNGDELFLKEAHGWTFAAQKTKDALSVLPMDPVALMGGLEKKGYNAVVQVNAGNIPVELKKQAVEAMKLGFDVATAQLEQEEPDLKQLTEGVYGQMVMQQLTALVHETDQLTIGWALDAKEKTTYIDFTMTAVAGSDLAKQFEINKGAKSEYAGFLIPNSAASLNFISKMPKADVEVSVKLMDDYRRLVIAEIEKDENLSAEELEVVRDMIGEFFNVLTDTIKTGTLDGGATLLLEDDSVTFVAGGHVVNAKSLEGPLRNLIEVAKEEPGFPKVKMDAGKHGDVAFHQASIPIPAGDVQGRQIFGESLDVVLGIGSKSVYFALGNECMPTLRKVMDASGGAVSDNAPQGQFTISLGPIMRFAANISGDPKAQEFAAKFKEGATNDKIRIISRSIDRGATSRVELDEGVFPLFGELVKIGMARRGGL